jgi:lipid-binding SYLF domain-containing protein
MRALIATLALAVAANSATAADLSTKEVSRVKEAATVLREIHAVPDKDVPQELWDKAECVIVVPGLTPTAAQEKTALTP